MMNTRIIKNTSMYMGRFLRREINYYKVRPINLLLFLTYRCTSRCASCTMWQRTSDGEEMTLEQLKNVIDKAKEEGVRHVELFGGDALLRKDVLFSLARHIKSKGLAADLVTNCNLLDRSTARELVAAGLDTIYTSLDGTGELHDRVRGKVGSFDRVRESIEDLLRERGSKKNPRIVLNCTVSALNVDGFEKIVPFAQETGVDKIAFEYVGEFPPESLTRSAVAGIPPEPYYMPQNNSILLSRAQAILLKRKIREIRENARHMSVRVSTKNIDTLHIDNMCKGMFPNRKCYVSHSQVTVDPYGNVIPCPFYRDYSLGNLRETPLKSVWGTGRHRAFMDAVGERRNEMCRYCILGVERNPSFIESLRAMYFVYARKGYEE